MTKLEKEIHESIKKDLPNHLSLVLQEKLKEGEKAIKRVKYLGKQISEEAEKTKSAYEKLELKNKELESKMQTQEEIINREQNAIQLNLDSKDRMLKCDLFEANVRADANLDKLEDARDIMRLFLKNKTYSVTKSTSHNKRHGQQFDQNTGQYKDVIEGHETTETTTHD